MPVKNNRWEKSEPAYWHVRKYCWFFCGSEKEVPDSEVDVVRDLWEPWS